MTDQEQTVEEFNAREKRRASIVARLHGYTPWESGDTKEGLKAEYLRHLLAKLTAAERKSKPTICRQPKNGGNSGVKRNWTPTARSSRTPRPTDSWIAARFGMRSDGISRTPNGNYYSSLGVAYRWIEEAGEEVVYLIPDGIHRCHQERADWLLSRRLRPSVGRQGKVGR